MYTQQMLDEMITCSKTLADEPKGGSWDSKFGSLKRNLTLIDEEGRRYYVYVRRNQRLPESFSVGLDHVDATGKHLKLLRFNGPHAGGSDGGGAPWHDHHHIHRMNADHLAAGSTKLPHPAGDMPAFADWRQAVRDFAASIGAPEVETEVIGTNLSLPGFGEY